MQLDPIPPSPSSSRGFVRLQGHSGEAWHPEQTQAIRPSLKPFNPLNLRWHHFRTDIPEHGLAVSLSISTKFISPLDGCSDLVEERGAFPKE